MSRWTVVACALLIAGAGCSSSSPDDVSATLGGSTGGGATSTTGAEVGADPCGLLSAEQVVQTLGAEVGEGSAGSAGDCSWSTPGGATSVVLAVDLGAEVCDLHRSEAAVPVEGLAGEAWWEFLAESSAGSVTVCLGEEVRTVTVTADAAVPTDEAALRGQAEALALAASSS